MTGVAVAGRRAAHSPVMTGLARAGLAARGIVYLLMGWLAIEIATGGRAQQANQKGALAAVADRTGGSLLLVLLAVGFAAYGLWRLSQSFYGTVEDGRKTWPRIESAVRAIVYFLLAGTAVGVLTGGSGSGQAQQQAGMTARLMRHTGGRWLVGVVGLVVLVIGLVMIVDGLRRKFEKELHTERMSEPARRTVLGLGAFGTVARGVVIGLSGALIADAALTADPRKSQGLDGALRTLAHTGYGTWLLVVAAVGLIGFGLYGLASARYGRT